MVSVAVAVTLAAAPVAFALWSLGLSGDTEEPPSTPASSTAASTSPPDLGLPQGAPLPDTTVVAPLTVGGNTDLYLLDTTAAATEGPLTTAAEEDLAPLISPDRRTILYTRFVGEPHDVELRVMASDGTGDRPLFDGPVEGCTSPMRPGWNPADPGQLAVACYAGGDAQLRVMTLDGATVRALDAGVPFVDDVSFSPDGTRIVYWGQDTAGVGDGHVYSLPADGSGGPVQLTDVAGNADAVWSPDGTQIAFRRAAQSESRIYVMAADGSDERPITGQGAVDQDPTWSPDGDMLAFKSNRDGPLPGEQVWVIDVSGDGLRQLEHTVDGVATNAPAWGHR
jgi:Tol biopolymer transport system component